MKWVCPPEQAEPACATSRRGEQVSPCPRCAGFATFDVAARRHRHRNRTAGSLAA